MSFFDDAACKGKRTSLWFALPAGNQYQQRSKRRQENDLYAYARSICNACPVEGECLRYALDLARQGETVAGMWGGLDEIERAELVRRERRRSA